MKDVDLNYDNYYINQGDANFSSIKFKNNRTTVKSAGCFVCAIAMKLCKETNSSSISDKQNAIKAVIDQITDSRSYVNYNKSVTFNGYTAKVTQMDNLAGQLLQGHAYIARVPGHFVLVVGYDTSKIGLDGYIVKDPGNKNNKSLQDVILQKGSLDKRTYKIR